MLLCLLMLGGEIIPGSANPMALVFYCFLPAVLWMITRAQTRAAQAISQLKARIDGLEQTQRDINLPVAE
jgi:hypothetical protein